MASRDFNKVGLGICARMDRLADTSGRALGRPHNVKPHIETARVVLAVKNFSSIPGVCHIGLGVTALNTQKVLRRAGVHCEVWSAQTAKELREKIEKAERHSRYTPVTHIIVSSPAWVQPQDFEGLCNDFPEIEFVQLNHSGTAYLSIDKYGIRNIRAVIDLAQSHHNLRVAGNNPRFVAWAAQTFDFDCLLLPNLYDVKGFTARLPMRKIGHVIRIGSFGASRPWKNQLTAAEAAVELAHRLGVDLELYVNSKRPDGGERMIESRLELFKDLQGARLIDVPWQPWPRFRQTVRAMHLLFSPSFDETFNVVTADGIAEGVCSVAAPAIEWAPESWWCEPSDPGSLVKVAMRLIADPHAIEDGRDHLRAFVRNGLKLWLDYIQQDTPLE
jgi:glycosyltransferase involved in cell wall biosynthesis